MIARGLLRHRFHGSYTAVLVLAFEIHEAAIAGLAIVGAPFALSSDPRAIVGVLTSDMLDAFKAAHAARITIDPCNYRHCHPRAKGTSGPCKGRAIDALTHSIDVGPAFTFDAYLGIKLADRVQP